jgi:hypothetical protein
MKTTRLLHAGKKCGKALSAHTRSTDGVAGCSNCFSQVLHVSGTSELPIAKRLHTHLLQQEREHVGQLFIDLPFRRVQTMTDLKLHTQQDRLA